MSTSQEIPPAPDSRPPRPEPPSAIDLGPRAPWIGVAAYALTGLTFAAAVLFESLVVARVPLSEDLLGSATVVARESLSEHVAGIEWRAAVLLLLGASVAALVVAARSIRGALRTAPVPAAALGALGVLVAVVSTFVFSNPEHPTSLLLELGRYVERHGAGARTAELADLVLLPKRCAEVVAGIVGIGIAAVAVLPSRVDARELERRVQALRILLFVSAALFVTGILMNQAAYAWLVAFLELEGVEESVPFAGLVSAGTRLAGAFYTLLLTAAYVPVAVVLAVVGKRLAAGSTDGSKEEASAWLAERGFVVSWRQQLARIGALSAPLVSSAVAQFLTAAA